MTPKTPHRGALVACAITLLLLLSGCSSKSTAAPLETPPPDATPEQVVGAYIQAINAQDPSILAAIAPGLAQSTIDGWFGTTIEEVQIDAARDGTQLAIGTDYEGQDNAWVHIDAVFHHTDGSLPEGELTGWGYYLTRDEPSSSWYIWTQGSS